MQLYAGPSTHFIRDSTHNQIAEKLRAAFFNHYRYKPGPGELNAWRNSLRATAQVFQEAGLTDHGVLLEYRLPLTSKRLDCMVCGRRPGGEDRAVVIELKQWEQATEAVGDKLVTTWVGGAEREVLHPSAQVGQYQLYLQDTHTAFHEGPTPVALDSCAYLHNYLAGENDVLFGESFAELVESFPVFVSDDVPRLKDFLSDRLSAGQGLEVLRRIERSRYRPSRKLMEHVSEVIKGRSEYVLLDEQLVVYEKVLHCAKTGFHDRRKNVLIVRGGPGTGKSVVAINLMADLLPEYNAHYATGSRAFTETLRQIIGRRGAVQFKYFNSYGDADPNAVDVLICDEAHRLRERSWNRFTPRAERSEQLQVEEVISAASTSVFFIDDDQVVRPDEVGSVEHIRSQAERMGCRIHEYELEAQFRCSGSDAFVNWINNTLGVRRTANVIWEGDEGFDFGIADSPEALDTLIREKAASGHSARMTAGFCWPWAKKPNDDGTLKEDVEIGDFSRPWNARPEARKLAEGVPKATVWAHEPGGLDQVGCIYTAQGFEFDYVGVIWGPDLVYDFEQQDWRGHKEHSYDSVVKRSKDRFADLVKNTYRVLLSRGLKDCYVHFMDRDTERFVRSRMDLR